MPEFSPISTAVKKERSLTFFGEKRQGFFAPIIQPKLTINQPNDMYEQEADAMADKVMRMSDNKNLQPPFFTPAISPIQRKCSECEEEEKVQMKQERGMATQDTATGSVNEALNAGGQPLTVDTRSFMEERFGYDFKNVQVHTDSLAHQSSKDINALAYTHGNHIVFGAGQYQPGSNSGKQLLAHELTHVVQQENDENKVQRKPLDQESSTDEIHKELLEDFSRDTNTPLENASRFSPEYSRWLTIKSGSSVRFSPPSIVKENPLTRRKNNQSEGFTELTINGKLITGNTFGNLIGNITNGIRPSSVEHTQLPGNNWTCQFAQNFIINTSAKITIPTAPGQNGWQENMNPAAILLPADMQRFSSCAGKATVPVTLHGSPSDQAFAQVVHTSELEHVKELERLHKRHFVPYYNFVMNLTGRGSTQADCEADLYKQINKQDEQAATAFQLGDMAETKKYDDPASTHHASIIPTVGANCSSITLAANMNNQQANLAPGNVSVVTPVGTVVNPANLTVTGNVLKDGNTIIRQFSKVQFAQQALAVLQHYQITSINRIGPFTYLLSGTNPPSGQLQGLNELAIDPNLFQVTLGMPNVTNWVISQVKGDAFFSILDFGALRDETYSAVDIMRGLKFTNQCWIGSANNPEFSYFRVD